MPPWLSKLFVVGGDDAVRLMSRSGRAAASSKGLMRGGSVKASLKSGWGAAAGGYMFMQLPLAMYETAHAERGHKLSTFGSAATPFLGTGLATLAFGGLPGMALGMALDPIVKKTVGAGIQAMANFGRNSPRVQTGGNYRDSQTAFTMRQAAAQEMSRSLLNARQYLGKESVFLHS